MPTPTPRMGEEGPACLLPGTFRREGVLGVGGASLSSSAGAAAFFIFFVGRAGALALPIVGRAGSGADGSGAGGAARACSDHFTYTFTPQYR